MNNEELIIKYKETQNVEFLNEFLIINQERIRKIVSKKTKNLPAITRDDQDDLVQEVTICIYNEIHHYNPTKGIKVFSFLEPYIKSTIYTWLRTSKGCISITKYTWDQNRKAQKSEKMGDPQNFIYEKINTIGLSIDNDDISSKMITADNTIEHILSIEQKNTLQRCISQIPYRFGKEILSIFYKDKSATSIANELGISKVRVSQIKKKALADLSCMKDIKALA